MNRVFLSYSHKDASDVAEFLYTRLMGAGYAVFKDDHSLTLGSSFPTELSKALGDHNYFLVLLTTAALESNWVRDEIDMAIVAELNIIPIVLEDIEIPLYLKKRHCLMMKERTNDWEALHKLVNDLGDGKNIPRVYNMSGRKDFEVKGILILGHSEFVLADLKDPSSMANIAESMAEKALPYIERAGAGIVPPGHSALACSILAHLLGTRGQMPRLFYTHKPGPDNFCINSEVYVALQDMRDAGFEYRSQNPK
ncbi:MAG: toll/interleukin-1 receptor domain-containing protein [Deltaproteobacteria bacterium]|nr:toll/interleukin-1 receptor domain-containing protein [Deltaproteobacteria bacterium]